ncbi:hypothetical protein HY251_09830, partial [bacterium]|nr:hypothetical protein [bacterium]
VFDLVTLPVALARAASSESSEDDERPEPPAPAPPGTPAPGPAQPPVPEVAPVASWHVAGIVFARKDDAPPETLPVGIHARPLPRLTEREGLRPVSFERCHCSVRPRLPDGSTGELLDPYVFWPDARVPGSLHVSGREREALSLLHVRIVVPGYSAVEGDVPAHGTFVAVVEETR